LEMRPNKYNYYIPYKNRYIFYNGLTDMSFEVSKQNSDAMRSIIENPNIYSVEYANFIAKMTNAGFIVPDEFNELDFIKKKNEYSTKST
ncbi:MAG: hypothetical protein NC338_02370, partial [Firmicutes bacterium]|nr:hypothetical protein [Bacillota bacterium]